MAEYGIVDSDTERQWFAIVENPNPDWLFEKVLVRLLDVTDGSAEELSWDEVPHIYANERVALSVELDRSTELVDKVLEIEVVPASFVSDSREPSIHTSQASWQPDSNGGQVTARVVNTFDRPVTGLKVLALVRDQAGVVLATESQILDYLPPNSMSGVAVPFGSIADVASAECYVTVVGTTEILEGDQSGLLEIEATGIVSTENHQIANWHALLQNHHPSEGIADGEVMITLLDMNGTVLAIDSAQVGAITAGGQSLVTIPVPAYVQADDIADVVANVRISNLGGSERFGLTAENVTYLDDQGLPRIEGTIRSSMGQALTNVELRAVAIDHDGQILTVGSGRIDEIPALGWAFGQVFLAFDSGADSVASVALFARP